MATWRQCQDSPTSAGLPGEGLLHQVLGEVHLTGEEVRRTGERAAACGDPLLEALHTPMDARTGLRGWDFGSGSSAGQVGPWPVPVSPSFSAVSSRIWIFRIFPVTVIGNSSTIST